MWKQTTLIYHMEKYPVCMLPYLLEICEIRNKDLLFLALGFVLCNNLVVSDYGNDFILRNDNIEGIDWL